MMNVSIDTDGTGVVTLPGQSVPITAADSDAARAQAVEVLVAYTATTGRRQYAHAIDTGTSLMLTIDPDGAVTVDREHARALAPVNEPTADEEPAQPIREIVDELPATPAVIPEPAADTAPAPTPHIDPDFELTSGGERRSRVRGAMITFDDGSTEIIGGTILLGRRPPEDAEGVDATVTVDDPARSVSKSHCILSFHDGTLWVTDQSSANGTTVTEPGKDPIDLTPGHAQTVVTGTRLHIGDRSFTVTIPAPRATRPR